MRVLVTGIMSRKNSHIEKVDRVDESKCHGKSANDDDKTDSSVDEVSLREHFSHRFVGTRFACSRECDQVS
jgi:hypothetical protein